MRMLITTFVMAGVLGATGLSAVNAAPVPGYEAFYQAAVTACSPVDGAAANADACVAAINAYSAALIAAGIDLTVALASFAELRAEVKAAGGGSVIEALFEELMPESGSIGPVEASAS